MSADVQLKTDDPPNRFNKSHQEHKEEQSTSEEKKYPRKRRARLIPIWMRLVIVILLMLLSLTAGLMVGYGVIGDGEPLDAIKTSTWTKLVDLITEDVPPVE
ncbi:DNA-directed RNA polymerase subunit beta [Bacillus tianshenii]|nr:DNA-directed RNA polymerase subunit beta [Bacillus tianshenii]